MSVYCQTLSLFARLQCQRARYVNNIVRPSLERFSYAAAIILTGISLIKYELKQIHLLAGVILRRKSENYVNVNL